MNDGMLAWEGQDAPADLSLCAALERVYLFVALLAPDGAVVEANSAAAAKEEVAAFPARVKRRSGAARSEGLGRGSAFVVSLPILDEALFPHRPGRAMRRPIVRASGPRGGR